MNGPAIQLSGAPRRQRGVTLVELMIALLLGLLLTAGIIQVFVGNRTTYAYNDGLSRIQENGRFALEFMAHSTRMAGYTGCLSDVPMFNNLNGADTFAFSLDVAVEGFNANGTGPDITFQAAAVNPAPSTNAGDWSPALPAELTGRVLPGSDVLVVRNVSPEANSLVFPFSDSAQVFVEQPHGFAQGQILVTTDCQKASVFQATNVRDTGFGVNLVHSQSGQFTPGNSTPVWGSDQEYGEGAEVAAAETVAFYIGRSEVTGAPALFQLRLGRASDNTAGFFAEELVDNVETMQVRYGEDTTGNSAVDTWQRADQVLEWSEVRSVEISLLVRAPDEYGTDIDTAAYNLNRSIYAPVDDRRLRQVFSTTVGIRNRLP